MPLTHEATPIPDSLALVGRATLELVAAAGGKPKQRRFTIVGYSGEPMTLGWWSDPVVVEMSGIEAGLNGDGVLPILDNHGPARYSGESFREYVVGQSESARVEKGEFVLRGALIEVNPAAQNIIALADKGFSWQASIGAQCLQKDFIAEGNSVEVNGRTFDGPIYVSRRTVVREVSFVVIGADGKTSVVVASGSKPMPEPAKTPETPPIVAKEKQTFSEYCKSKGFDAQDLDEAQKKSMKKFYKASVKDDGAPEPDDKGKTADDLDDSDGKDKDATKTKAGAVVTIKAAGEGAQAAGSVAEHRKQMAAEMGRVSAIKKIFGSKTDLEFKHGEATVNLMAHAVSEGWDVEKTQNAFELADLRASRPTASPFCYSPSSPQMSAQVLESAILQAGNCQLDSDSYYMDGKERRVPEPIQRRVQTDMRARYPDQVQQAAHDLFKGRLGLQQTLSLVARSNGYQGSDVINDGNLAEVLRYGSGGGRDIRAEGGSTMSLQNLLANVMNKFLLAGYLYVDQSWRSIAAIRPVKDFKPTKSVNIFGDFVYKKLGADGQIQNAAMTDEAFSNQVDTFGRKLNITRPTIINDDLSALSTVPQLSGIGAADALSILFWSVWLVPGNGPDGNAFWYNRTATANLLGGGAANTNLVASGAGSALSSASLQVAKQQFDKQVKPNGQPLGVDPALLLIGPEQWVTGRELLNAQFIVYGGASASKQPNTNIWAGSFILVKSPYLSNPTFTGYSATAWWLLANPQRIAAIEVAFLNGQEMPTVQTIQAIYSGENELGINVVGFHDFGVTMQNIRAGQKSPGA